MAVIDVTEFLTENHIYHGDSRILLKRIRPESIALSVWSPPYFVGKAYEKDLSFSDWESLLREVIKLHFPIVKPGGFLAINIADILCFKDVSMPKIMAENVSRRKIGVTKEQILEVKKSTRLGIGTNSLRILSVVNRRLIEGLTVTTLEVENTKPKRGSFWLEGSLRTLRRRQVFIYMTGASGSRMQRGKIRDGIQSPTGLLMSLSISTFFGNRELRK